MENEDDLLKKLVWSDTLLQDGDWVYTPDEVFGSSGKEHNIFQWDSRITYSLHLGHSPKYYKLEVPPKVWAEKKRYFKTVRPMGNGEETMVEVGTILVKKQGGYYTETKLLKDNSVVMRRYAAETVEKNAKEFAEKPELITFIEVNEKGEEL